MGDLRPKYPPAFGESLGLNWWRYAASLSIVFFLVNSCGVRIFQATRQDGNR